MHVGHALGNDLPRPPRAGLGARPGVADGGLGQQPAVEGHGDLELLGAGRAARARHAHAVRAVGGKAGGGEVGHHVGREVARGIVDLVEKLLLHRLQGHAAAGAGQLGDDRAAVRAHLGDGKAHVGQVGHGLDARVGEVAAGDLRGALHQVPHRGAGAQARPVVAGPAVGVAHGRQEQRGVGHAPGDDHVGARLQRGQQGVAADVGVGAHQRQAHRLHRAARLGQGGVRADQPRHLVALHAGHPQAVQPQLAGHGHGALGGAAGVGRAHVGHHPRAPRPARRQDGAEAAGQQLVVARARVAHAVAVAEGQRALAHALEHDGVQRAALPPGPRPGPAGPRRSRRRCRCAGYRSWGWRRGGRAHAPGGGRRRSSTSGLSTRSGLPSR